MIEFLFLDLDDTILDFHKAERIAISKTIRAFGVEPTEEVLKRYHEKGLHLCDSRDISSRSQSLR